MNNGAISLEMKAGFCFETSVTSNPGSQRRLQEELNSELHSCERVEAQSHLVTVGHIIRN